MCQTQVVKFKVSPETEATSSVSKVNAVKFTFYSKLMRVALSNLLTLKQVISKTSEAAAKSKEEGDESSQIATKISIDYSLKVILPIIQVKFDD